MRPDTDFANPYEKEIHALEEKVKALEAELEKKEEADWGKIIEDFKFEYSKKGVEGRMAFNQNVLSLITYPFWDMLKDATNYVEITLVHKEEIPHQEIIVTLQKKSGKTPHTLRKEAEAEVERLNKYVIPGYEEGIEHYKKEVESLLEYKHMYEGLCK